MTKNYSVLYKDNKYVFLNRTPIGLHTKLANNENIFASYRNINIPLDISIVDLFDQDFKILIINYNGDSLFIFEKNLYQKSYFYFSEIEGNYDLSYRICLDFDYWNLPFTKYEFIVELNEVIKNSFIISVDALNDFNNVFTSGDSGFEFYINVDDINNNIESLRNKVLVFLKQKIDLVFEKLTQQNNFNRLNLTNTFTFPPEIQSSCEQYLIYFATFLKDIGINAATNIESKTHETLFTVIPKDGEEALDKIKEALQMYLSLPESPDFESAASEFTDIKVQQLASQVYFYKSQLALASSMLQLKDKQIESLNMTIYQQETSVEVQVLEEKNEESLGKYLTITEFKLNGLTVNSPEMVRFLKRVFRIK